MATGENKQRGMGKSRETDRSTERKNNSRNNGLDTKTKTGISRGWNTVYEIFIKGTSKMIQVIRLTQRP